jgi:hypothetical protein
MMAWRWSFILVFSSWPVPADRGAVEVISEFFIEFW